MRQMYGRQVGIVYARLKYAVCGVYCSCAAAVHYPYVWYVLFGREHKYSRQYETCMSEVVFH